MFGEAGAGTIRRRDVWNSVLGLESETIHRPAFIVGGGLTARVGRVEAEVGYRVGALSTRSSYERLHGARGALGVRF